MAALLPISANLQEQRAQAEGHGFSGVFASCAARSTEQQRQTMPHSVCKQRLISQKQCSAPNGVVDVSVALEHAAVLAQQLQPRLRGWGGTGSNHSRVGQLRG